MKSQTRIRIEKTVVLIIMLGLTAAHDPAFAQATGDVFQPINNVFISVLNFMTGTFAKTAAMIAVGAVGFMALTSRIPWGWVFSIIVGVAFIFGGKQIVNTFASGVGSGSN